MRKRSASGKRRPRTLSADQARDLRNSLRAMGLDSYEDYLQTARWVKFRNAWRKGPAWKCCVCGDRFSLRLHHLRYTTLGRESTDDVIPICRSHHEQVHNMHVVSKVPLELAHIKLRQILDEVRDTV